MTFPQHFDSTAGTLAPQPWMQLRMVATTEAEAVARNYGITGGAAKNDLLQTLTRTWTNSSPVPQRVYGLVTQGGSSVALQTRSRGYLQMNHGFGAAADPTLTEVSRFGGGADTGMGGLLAIGTGFGIHEVRQPSTTIPLMPHLTGWTTVAPGASITAKVEVRFVSDFWEGVPIDGGDSNTQSMVIAGALRLDLFAVPVIADLSPRPIPQVVGSSINSAVNTAVTVTKPAGTAAGDILLAICGNNFGSSTDITAPAGWKLLHSVNDGLVGLNRSHLRLFTKTAGASEPASYTFGNKPLIEHVVCLVVLRNAGAVGGDIENLGWAVATTRQKWTKEGQLHIAPSISRNGQLLICVSFFSRTDNPLDNLIGPAAVTQEPPAGMTEIAERNGTAVSLSVAMLPKPPNPTFERMFVPTPRAYFGNWAISVSILVPGAQQL